MKGGGEVKVTNFDISSKFTLFRGTKGGKFGGQIG